MKAMPAVLIAMLVAATGVFAVEDDDDDDADAALAAVVKSAAVTLEQGFAASAGEGVPISGKFEFEVDGAQLSVYTAKGDAYTEVIVDHQNGRVAKVIPIVDGKDLTDARRQLDLMRTAKRSLADATERVLKANAGYRAVSAMPASRDGAPVAKLVVTNGRDWKTLYESLQADQ